MTNDEKRGQFPIMGDPRHNYNGDNDNVDITPKIGSELFNNYVQHVLHCDKCPFKGKEDACAELRKSYDLCEKYQPPGQPPRGPAAAA
jgi:hypothetical protein